MTPYPVCRTGDLTLDRALRCAWGDVVGNVVPASVGLLPPDTPVLMAGLTYEAWTRDAAINCWNLLSAADPVTARSTLLGEVVRAGDGYALRGQYWDAVVWILGAWDHWLWTGDREFLGLARRVGAHWLQRMEAEEFSVDLGLFRGPACYGDGIAAYPDRYARTHGLSCILDWVEANPADRHPQGRGVPMHSLSTNCLYQRAYAVLGEMDGVLGVEPDAHHAVMAERVAGSIRREFWMGDKGRFRYLVDPWGGDERQEGLGHAFACLFGLAADPGAVLGNLKRATSGLPCLWPTFPRYANRDPERASYGRHAGLIWPHVEGFAADAAARAGRPELAWATIQRFAQRALRDGQFSECYHPEDGLPDGGLQEIDPGAPQDWHAWCLGPQLGTHEGVPMHRWLSQPRTTWGATALWRLAVRVLAGLDPRSAGLAVEPQLPPGSQTLHLQGLHWRAAVLDLTVVPGPGRRLLVDGREEPLVPVDVSGVVRVESLPA